MRQPTVTVASLLRAIRDADLASTGLGIEAEKLRVAAEALSALRGPLPVIDDRERRSAEIVRQRTLAALDDASRALPVARLALRAARELLAGVRFDDDEAGFGQHRDLSRPCAVCGEEFRPSRSDARYCSARCRMAAKRQADRRTAAEGRELRKLEAVLRLRKAERAITAADPA